MKILVTGGAGFIASHIVDGYIAGNHKVIVVDNLSSGRRDFVNQKAKFYKLDIRKRKAVAEIIDKEKPHIINHHAAQISVRVSVDDPLLDAEENILGLLNILEPARKNKVKKIIFASSGGVVYGEADKLPTPESYYPLLPMSPYGVSKLSSEKYLHFYYKIHKIPYVALRYSNVYGPRQNPHGEAGVVAIFIQKLLNEISPTINGSGKQTRDYVYVEDVVKANILALGQTMGAFNIATGEETSVIELFNLLKKITGKDIDADFGPAKPGEQKRSCLDVSLAKKRLGWEPDTDLRTGFEKTVKYFQNS